MHEHIGPFPLPLPPTLLLLPLLLRLLAVVGEAIVAPVL
jgi:hypothetical protein